MRLSATRRAAFVALALLLLGIAAPAPAQNAPEPTLQPQWQVDQSARYETWSREVSTTTLTAQGETQSLATTIETASEQTWTVQSVQPDGAWVCKLETHFVEATVMLEAAGSPDGPQTITISSRNPTGEAEAFDKMVQAIVAHPLTLRVGPDGTIQSVEGGQQIRDALGELAALASTDEELMQQAEAVATLPGIPAALIGGGAWTDPDTSSTQVPVVPQMLELPGTLNRTTTFTLEALGEIEGVPVATLGTRTQTQLEVDTSELPAELPVAVQLVEADGTGEVILDLSRGEIVASHFTGSRTIRASLTGPDGQTLTSDTVTASQSQSLRIAEDQ